MSIFGANRLRSSSRAFALPTVLIASVVLLTVLAVSVTATAAVRTTLKNQYYAQLAQVAGEAGVAMAKACLANSGNVPEWTDAKPLTPATDCAGNQILTQTVKALVVAGGGSGGSTGAGGGGGGGVIYNDAVEVTNGTYTVAVGAGGATAANQNGGSAGANSSFNGLVATGGGGGGYNYYLCTTSGGSTLCSSSSRGPLSGGSSGGGTGANFSGTPTAVAGQGYLGSFTNLGGGGGAGGLGLSGGSTGGDGGPGAPYNISGAMVYYGAGGGGGNGGNAGVGGSGAGSGATGGGTAGRPNTGAGGGGGYADSNGTGGAGGSGVVILSYPKNNGMTATATKASDGSTIVPKESNGSLIYTFTGAGSFNISSLGTSSCPTDPRCAVAINGNVRSSFKVGLPTLDSNGRALTIPNTGYVNILRTSSGAVWRTYTQPANQAAAVPDLCSGNATSARGWAAAVKVTPQDSFAVAPSAQTISVANAPTIAGQMYFRKDFNVSRAGSYDLNVLSSSGQDIVDSYIDGKYISNATGGLSTTTTTLTPGCHTLVVHLTNATAMNRLSDFTAALTLQGSSVPTVVSDTSWRVSDGDQRHFSETNYDETSGIWEPALVYGNWNNTTLAFPSDATTWGADTGDVYTSWISTKYVVPNTSLSRPGASYAWFRQIQPFTTTAVTTVRLGTLCDNRCYIYLDGDLVYTTPLSDGIAQKDITIQPGTHNFGIRLYNSTTTANISGFMFTAVNKANGTVLARSDAGWTSTNFWTTTDTDLFSYDRTFVPTPTTNPTVNARALVVGGGGGGGGGYQGGGGGAGAVVYNAAYPLSVGNYNVVVGAGGAGTLNAPSVGGASMFDSIRAVGGGSGSSQTSSGTIYGVAGANGSGGAHPIPAYRTMGILSPLGYLGGIGVTVTSTSGSGGGGAGAGGNGANGTTTAGGVGGAAINIPSVSGAGINYGGGGGGTFRGSSASVAGGSSIGGNGGPTGGAGAANTGSGGGAGTNTSGTAAGGAGGSGVVVITYLIGSMTATGGTTTDLAGYRIHTFTTSGTFTVTSTP